jgi:3-methyladenine DNA glycosylase AlkD
MTRSVAAEAKRAIRELAAHAQPAGAFDPSRYFRATEHLEFHNVRTPVVRSLGRSIARDHRRDWTLHDTVAFADALIPDPHLEVKGVAIEALAYFRRDFTPSLLPTFKRWLATNRAANWATTDSICGSLIGPLLAMNPSLVAVVKTWTAHRNMWVRRAAAVSLVRLAARGIALDDAYQVATALCADPNDLIQKAAGWLLREAGRTDAGRLERYLRQNGPAIRRTTLRYAIERFPLATRRELLAVTKAPNRSAPGSAARAGSGVSGVRRARS